MKGRIFKNTDAIDIHDKCLGLDAYVEGLTKVGPRGLHIQIRHNGSKHVLEAAEKMSTLLTAAPDLLEACIEALETLNKLAPFIIIDAKDSLRLAIKKAEANSCQER